MAPPLDAKIDATRPSVHRGAKHVHGADDVDVGVVERIAHRFADVDLRGVVKDDLGVRVGHRGGELRSR